MKTKTYNQTIKTLLTIIVILVVLDISLLLVYNSLVISQNNQIEGEISTTVNESIDHDTAIPPANVYSRGLSESDKYLLAKIAMAEAEGENLETKVLVILVVLNRVESTKAYFPDTIEEVIFQSSNGVYQFSPVMPGGRWWRLEPNDECWKAVEIVDSMKEDISQGALYFEACEGESWHSRNLEFICQSSNTRFYK